MLDNTSRGDGEGGRCGGFEDADLDELCAHVGCYCCVGGKGKGGLAVGVEGERFKSVRSFTVSAVCEGVNMSIHARRAHTVFLTFIDVDVDAFWPGGNSSPGGDDEFDRGQIDLKIEAGSLKSFCETSWNLEESDWTPMNDSFEP